MLLKSSTGLFESNKDNCSSEDKESSVSGASELRSEG